MGFATPRKKAAPLRSKTLLDGFLMHCVWEDNDEEKQKQDAMLSEVDPCKAWRVESTTSLHQKDQQRVWRFSWAASVIEIVKRRNAWRVLSRFFDQSGYRGRWVTSSLSGVLSLWFTEIGHPGRSLTHPNSASLVNQLASWIRGFVHFATKEAALRILEESAMPSSLHAQVEGNLSLLAALHAYYLVKVMLSSIDEDWT